MSHLEWLVTVAGWMFLAGIVTMAAGALPPLGNRRPGLLGVGFLIAMASLALVLLAWAIPRLTA